MNKLLFITQKVDKDDDILGVYHEWIVKLAEKTEKISVICLYRGSVDLPSNVSLYSLGKESRQSRLKYIWRFYKYSWGLRKEYDAVFVHMNPEYVLLGWKLWRLLGKKILFWYNHPLGGLRARLAINLADGVFCTSPFAFAARYKKTEIMPVGIDTERFRRQPEISRRPHSILYLGRIAPIKKLEVLIKAMSVILRAKSEGSLRDSSPSVQNDQNITSRIRLTITGVPTPGKQVEEEYFQKIKDLVVELGLSEFVEFHPAVPNHKTPEIYNSHELSVNMTPTGSFDKAIIESMACETPVIVSNKSVSDILPQELVFEEDSAHDLAEKINNFFKLPESEKLAIGKKLRQIVAQKHSLPKLIEKLYSQLAAFV